MSRGQRTKVRRQELPLDVVEEILFRLPVNHVLRCRLLSKSHYSLIKNPSFINKHSLYSSRTSNPIIVVVEDRNSIRSLLSPSKESSHTYIPPHCHTYSDIELVGSCNGLLCIRLHHSSSVCHHTLWNPATREHTELPTPKLKREKDPFFSYDHLGFGQDVVSGDYKLVKIGDYSNEKTLPESRFFSVEVWSMSTNSWKDLGFMLPDLVSSTDYQFRIRAVLFSRGRLYWLLLARKSNVMDAVLISFDLSDDTFRKIRLPDDVAARRGRNNIFIIDFMGSVALLAGFSVEASDDQTLFHVWLMTEGGDNCQWTNTFSLGPFPSFDDVVPTRVCVKGNFVMKHMYYKFILYDPHRNKELQQDGFPIEVKAPDLTIWSMNESLVDPIKQA